MPTLVIADESSALRAGLSAFAKEANHFRIMAEVSDAREAITALQKHHPTILVLSATLPLFNGFASLREFSRASEDIRILIMSNRSDAVEATQALRHGASGFIMKTAQRSEFIDALHALSHARKFVAESVSEKLLAALSTPSESNTEQAYDRLTPREQEIFQLAAQGMKRQEISNRLFISSRTVETHRANILHKLGLRSQTELVRFAIRHHLVTP